MDCFVRLLGLLCVNRKTVYGFTEWSVSKYQIVAKYFYEGIEALIIETAITAKNYNVYNEVFESIANSMDNHDFKTFSNTLIKTHMVHKSRRCKEVKDSLNLIKEAHLDLFVTEGVANFFSNSVYKQIESDILVSHNVEHILDYYLSLDA